jgi:hypothetical protein
MLQKYKNIGTGALAVAVASFGLAVYFGQGSTTGNIWGPGGAPAPLVGVIVASVFVMFWAYAKSKGRSGWLGLFLPFLSIIGLIILLRLEDRSDHRPVVERREPGSMA